MFKLPAQVSITMAKGTSFVTSIDGINYEFLTNESITMQTDVFINLRM